ncbi:MAG TPA: MBL fold metallo-hydrolase [Candidatus Saccharimonadales bacterium]|nr:MBL fold metallo-hydrolase [Candidatus Saccharimonadales bacterium]
MRVGSFEDWQITALGHDGFLLENLGLKLRLVFDPFEVPELDPVDYVFISHHHYDHLDTNSIRKLLGPKTIIVAPKCCRSELKDFLDQVQIVEDRDKHQEKELTYWTVPAYNVNKFRTPNEVFHTKEVGGVGFVVDVGKTRFYHAGDTDFIPEMAELKKISVAFLPISGTFVMTLDEAVQATEVINPKLVIPMHYGKILGSVTDAIRFQNLLRDKVLVMVLNASAG